MHVLLKELFTGPDGTSYSFNKFAAAVTFFITQASFIGVGGKFFFKETTTIADWALFFQFGAVFQVTMGGVVIAYVTLQTKAEGGILGKKEPTDAT